MSLKKFIALAFLAAFAFAEEVVVGSTCAGGPPIVSLPRISREKTIKAWVVDGRKH